MSATAFAAALGVPANRITAILNGQRSVTADSALRIARYFGVPAQYWMNLQLAFELRSAEIESGESIERIVKPRASLRAAANAMPQTPASHPTRVPIQECVTSVRRSRFAIPRENLAAFCKANGIRRLAVFGSALRDDFDSDSDVDFLVEFEPGQIPGLLGIARIEIELSKLLGGRKADLRTVEELSPYFRAQVLDSAEVQYARG